MVRRWQSKLNKAGLVETRRGRGGGSVLAKNASQVNLRDVYDAVSDNSELLRRHPGNESRAAKVLANYINDLYGKPEQAFLAVNITGQDPCQADLYRSTAVGWKLVAEFKLTCKRG